MSSGRIARIDVWDCVVPLGRILEVSGRSLVERRYTLVRLQADEGVEGVAAALCRGQPTAAELGGLAPSLLGREVEHVWEGLSTSIRAQSLLDVAAADLQARAAGVPLWKFLGGPSATPVRTIVYGGFESDLEGELHAYVAAGYSAVKLARFADTPAQEAARLTRARDALGTEVGLIYDAGWSWSDAQEAARYAAAYSSVGLLWLEDPFPPDEPEPLAQLRTLLDGAMSVAAGDEWTDLAAYRAALDAIDVVRIDVMTIGGLAPWLEVAAAARKAGRLASAHVSDYVHVHLQAASGGEWVERVEPGTAIDPLDRLLRSTARFEDGRLVPPSDPGLGIEVDWQAVTAHQRAAWKA